MGQACGAMRWGLIPFWAKDAKIGSSTINARAETIAANAAYREAFKRPGCLVPADWFYEWRKIDAKTKVFVSRVDSVSRKVLAPKAHGVFERQFSFRLARKQTHSSRPG